MSPKSKREYLASILLPYRSSSKRRKSQILNEFCAVCGYHRKYAVWLLKHHKRFTAPKPKKRGRTSKYKCPAVLEPLKQIWLAAHLPCSSRLKAIIPLWMPFLPHALPSVKLLSKERVGSKTIKKHDTTKTPYQRTLESPHIAAKTKELLKEQFKTLNSFNLKKEMEKKLARIFNRH